MPDNLPALTTRAGATNQSLAIAPCTHAHTTAGRPPRLWCRVAQKPGDSTGIVTAGGFLSGPFRLREIKAALACSPALGA